MNTKNPSKVQWEYSDSNRKPRDYESLHGIASPSDNRDSLENPTPPSPAGDATPAKSYKSCLPPKVFTYFIQSERGGPIKIGRAKNPESRLRELQTSNPERLRIIATLSRDCESELHQRFASLRMAGEWFEPGQDLIAFLRQETPGDPAEEDARPSWHSSEFSPEKRLPLAVRHILATVGGEYFNAPDVEDDGEFIREDWMEVIEEAHLHIFGHKLQNCDADPEEADPRFPQSPMNDEVASDRDPDDCECESCLMYDAAAHFAELPIVGLLCHKETLSIRAIVRWPDGPKSVRYGIAENLSAAALLFDACYLNLHAILLHPDGEHDTVEMAPLFAGDWLDKPKSQWACAVSEETDSARSALPLPATPESDTAPRPSPEPSPAEGSEVAQ